MSVVSRLIDLIGVPPKKRGPRVAVQYNPGPNPNGDFTQGEVKACFSANRYNRPFIIDDNRAAPGVVGLAFNQEGYSAPSSGVFKGQKLVAPMPVPTRMRMTDTTEEINPPFPNYDYLAPIRPSPRKLTTL